MKKIQFIWLIAITFFTMAAPAFTMSETLVEPDSVKTGSVFKLSPELQKIYRSWNEETGSIVFPYIEYKVGEVINQITFFSDKEWFDTSVEIPSDILEFKIYLPTTKFGKYIKFTFSPERCHFPSPSFQGVDEETLRAIIRPQSESFISEGHYLIIIKYINISGKPTYAQCLLTQESSSTSKHLIAISTID